MSDGKRPDNDPSMDDILASIRKIISDDEARAQTAGQSTPTPVPAANEAAPQLSDPARLFRSPSTGSREDVLLLTDLIEEPKTAPEPAYAPRPAPTFTPEPEPAPAPIPMPLIDPVRASEMPQPTFDPPPVPSGDPVGSSVASAFDRLSQAMRQSDPEPAPVHIEPGPALGAGGKTIEEVVKEMLRPMLKEWIDRNLPPMVERLVEREIAKLTRR